MMARALTICDEMDCVSSGGTGAETQDARSPYGAYSMAIWMYSVLVNHPSKEMK